MSRSSIMFRFTAATFRSGTPSVSPGFSVPSLLYLEAQSGEKPWVLPPQAPQKWCWFSPLAE